MSFDFPPASDASTTIGSLTRRFDTLRQTFQAEREERSAASRDRPSHGMPTPPPTMPRPRRMARPRRGSGNGNGILPPSMQRRTLSPMSSAPFPPIPDRLRQVADGTRQQLRRLRQEMHGDTETIAEELRERRDLLDRMSNHLDGMLQRRDSPSNASELSSRAETETRLHGIDHGTSAIMPRRRSFKRRKLTHHFEDAVPERYGFYGQVEPGRLRLEIVSCDGGQFHPRDSRSFNLEMYRAENVLRRDESVYCTKSSRCNMMFRQKGETLFHLEKIEIAAPSRGYTAPIQQGLVFVGMSADKLTAATSTYSIQYSDNVSHATRTRSPTPQARDAERLSFLEAVNDDQIWRASRGRYDLSEPPVILPPPQAHILPQPLSSQAEAWRERVRLINSSAAPGRNLDEPPRGLTPGSALLDNCDWPPIHDGGFSGSGLTRAPTPPAPFTVTATMESSDDEAASQRDDRENSYGPYGLPPILPRDAMESDTDGDTSETSTRHRISRLQAMHNNFRRPRPMRRSTPGEIGRDSVDAGDEEDDVLEPDARFFMPENDCRITIRFEPPVAGKFILLKLFSPQLRDGPNIDIEYVAAHGFSGPRFFPSVEMK